MTEKSISTVKRVCAAGVAVATVFASSVAVSAAELPHVRSQRITENFTDAIQAAHERIAMEKSGETAMMREASKSIDESIAEAYPTVLIDGKKYEGYAYISRGTTYVAVSEMSAVLGAESVTYGEKTVVGYKGKEIAFDPAEYVVIHGGDLFVPIREIAAFFGYNVGWSGQRMEVTLNTPGPQSSNQNVEEKTEKTEYTQDELYWLSRIIQAEAGGESFLGKLAVGNVVLNRVRDSRFPSTVYGVIFDCSIGVYQFSPVANGTVYNTPSADSVEAARQCLGGKVVAKDALFFMNGAIADTAWIAENRPYIMTIGNHQFYA